MDKIIMVSSSGGHLEELLQLKFLEDKYKLTWVSEKTKYKSKLDYRLIQTGSKDALFPFKMMINFLLSLYIIIVVRPKFIISTGSMVCIPFFVIARFTRIKTIYIESFACVECPTKTGRFLYGKTDLFIVQWETLLKQFPNAVNGGSIF